MQFGVCCPILHAPALAAAGWDFVEPSVQDLLRGDLADSQWSHPAPAATPLPLPIHSANCFLPGAMKVTGPDVDFDGLVAYAERIVARAVSLNMKYIVFGSGAARAVPPGFDKEQAFGQIVKFLKAIVPAAGAKDCTFVIEHLRHAECNIINTLDESLNLLRAVNSPGLLGLVDSFHYWQTKDTPENLKAILPWVRHVHIAEPDENRGPPSAKFEGQFKDFFRQLKAMNYDRTLSVESPSWTPKDGGGDVLKYVKKLWAES